MLPITWTTVRLFLHVLAATVWVGGQITLAELVHGLRAIDDGAPRAAARRFNRIAWPAYGVLVATGIWHLLVIDVGATTTEWQVTLGVKLVVVALSGIGAAAHTLTSSRKGLAIWGAVSAATALAAVFVGVMLANAR